MWFKNLYIFRFLKPFTLSPEELHEKLSQWAFQSCGRLEMSSIGWEMPLGQETHSFTHTIRQCILFKLRKEEKILPASVIRDFMNEKIEEIESQEMRKVSKREKETIREEVLQDLVPRAFTRSRHTAAIINIKQGWLAIDTSSQKVAEEFVDFLRKTLESLPVTLPKVLKSTTMVMTQWLIHNGCPGNFEIADSCELMDGAKEGAVIYCKRQNLLSDEIRGHLNAGKLVTRLALEWKDHLAFVIDEELVVKRLHLLEGGEEEADETHSKNEIEHFDRDFALMSLELSALIPDLFELFGGEDEKTYDLMR